MIKLLLQNGFLINFSLLNIFIIIIIIITLKVSSQLSFDSIRICYLFISIAPLGFVYFSDSHALVGIRHSCTTSECSTTLIYLMKKMFF